VSGKPMGIGFGVADGSVVVRVNHPSPVEDKIWNAVTSAVENGWDARRFVREAWSAWEDKLTEDTKHALAPFEQMLKVRVS
jgi:hypothetical protein